MKFTIFGKNGFIGTNLAMYLGKQGHDVVLPGRDEYIVNENLGHVIYAIGVTGDFKERPIETIEAHICHCIDVIRNNDFDSFLYLSSTRVYRRVFLDDASVKANESSEFKVSVDLDSLYDLSKIMGEMACYYSAKNNVRVARLSNVFGCGQAENSFLSDLVISLRRSGFVKILESQDVSRDFIPVEDVVQLIERISIYGKGKTYNVASGFNITNTEIAKIIMKKCNMEVLFSSNGVARHSPVIDIQKIREEFMYNPNKNKVKFEKFLISALKGGSKIGK